MFSVSLPPSLPASPSLSVPPCLLPSRPPYLLSSLGFLFLIMSIQVKTPMSEFFKIHLLHSLINIINCYNYYNIRCQMCFTLCKFSNGSKICFPIARKQLCLNILQSTAFTLIYDIITYCQLNTRELRITDSAMIRTVNPH